MVELILGFLAYLIITCITVTGYAGVFVLMFIESCGVPAPSEVSMPFAGYLVSTGRFDFWLVVLAGTLGNVLGSLLAYWIGARGGRPLLERYGKYVGISARHLDAADGWFQKHGEVAVFGGRLLPVVRTYISFPAGAARMNLKKFIAYTTLGVFLWALLFTWFGMKLAAEWNQIHERLQFLNILVVVGILVAAVYLWYRHTSKK
jgi:membrane protein DedA with SNARE-associated domain